LVPGRDVGGAETLRDAQQEPTGDRAEKIAEAAHDDDRERLHRRLIAHCRVDPEDAAQQDTGRAGQRGAERERGHVHTLDVHAGSQTRIAAFWRITGTATIASIGISIGSRRSGRRMTRSTTAPATPTATIATRLAAKKSMPSRLKSVKRRNAPSM